MKALFSLVLSLLVVGCGIIHQPGTGAAGDGGGSGDTAKTGSDSSSSETTTATRSAVLTSISPGSVGFKGGQKVTLTGTDFKTGMSITFGNSGCTSLTIISATEANCISPTNSIGVTIDVTLTDSSSSKLSGAYTYGHTRYAQISGGSIQNIIVLDDESLLGIFGQGYDYIKRVDHRVPEPQMGYLYNATTDTFTSN